MIADIISLVSYILVFVASIVVILVCACSANQMNKDTCPMISCAFHLIFAGAISAIAMLFIRTPSIMEALILSGLALLFLFDRRKDYEDTIMGVQSLSKDKESV